MKAQHPMTFCNLTPEHSALSHSSPLHCPIVVSVGSRKSLNPREPSKKNLQGPKNQISEGALLHLERESLMMMGPMARVGCVISMGLWTARSALTESFCSSCSSEPFWALCDKLVALRSLLFCCRAFIGMSRWSRDPGVLYPRICSHGAYFLLELELASELPGFWGSELTR